STRLESCRAPQAIVALRRVQRPDRPWMCARSVAELGSIRKPLRLWLSTLDGGVDAANAEVGSLPLPLPREEPGRGAGGPAVANAPRAGALPGQRAWIAPLVYDAGLPLVALASPFFRFAVSALAKCGVGGDSHALLSEHRVASVRLPLFQ